VNLCSDGKETLRGVRGTLTTWLLELCDFDLHTAVSETAVVTTSGEQPRAGIRVDEKPRAARTSRSTCPDPWRSRRASSASSTSPKCCMRFNAPRYIWSAGLREPRRGYWCCWLDLFIEHGETTVLATSMVGPTPAPGPTSPVLPQTAPTAAVRFRRRHAPDWAQAPRVPGCAAGTAGIPGVGHSSASVRGENDPAWASVDAGQHMLVTSSRPP
jgi:hypothetical protein